MTHRPRRPGLWFQDLTAIVEKAFVGDPLTSVKSPAYLLDNTSGARREFDVLIERRHDHHMFRTAIECKDYKRPVEVGVVEALAKKRDDCRVHRAIIVARSGFTDGALKKAAVNAIDCMMLAPADASEARVGVDLRQRTVFLREVHYGIRGADRPVEPIEAFAATGEPVTTHGMNHLADRAVPAPSDEELETGVGRYHVILDGPAGLVVRDAKGREFSPDQIDLLVECFYSTAAVAMDHYLYEGQGRRFRISLSREAMGGEPGARVVFVEDEDGLRGGLIPPVDGPEGS